DRDPLPPWPVGDSGLRGRRIGYRVTLSRVPLESLAANARVRFHAKEVTSRGQQPAGLVAAVPNPAILLRSGFGRAGPEGEEQAAVQVVDANALQTAL